jgi:hypothetical protein
MSLVAAQTPITPPSLARCDELAARFLEQFPGCSALRCRQTVAALLFFPSWEALREASRHDFVGQARDGSLDEQALQARVSAQIDVLCQKIGGFGRKSGPSLLERRSFVLLAREVLEEHSPSADEACATRSRSPCRVRMTLSECDWLESFPQKLSQWWGATFPTRSGSGAI